MYGRCVMRHADKGRLEAIWQEVEQEPGIRPGRVAKELGIPRSSVMRALPALDDEGLLLYEDQKGGGMAVETSGMSTKPHRWSAPMTETPTELATTETITEGPSFVMVQKELSLNWKEVFFLTWQRMLAHNWVAAFAEALGGVYCRMTVARMARKFIIRPGTLLLKGDELWVLLEPFPDQAALTDYLEWVNQQRFRLPWLNNLILQIAVSAHQPTGRPMREAQMRKRLFAG